MLLKKKAVPLSGDPPFPVFKAFINNTDAADRQVPDSHQ